MNYIVGDIGNTSTRICLLNKNFIIKNFLLLKLKIYLKKIILIKELANF